MDYTYNLRRRTAGSALIGVMILMAALSMVILAMIGVANHNTRVTRAQLEYEAAYTAAMSGIHTARAMLNYPTLTLTMLNKATLGKDVEGLLDLENNLKNTLEGVPGMVADVLTGDLGGLIEGVDPLTGGLLERHGLGSLLNRLPDGRIVLIDVPQSNGKVMGFVNDKNGGQFTESLYSGESSNGFDSYVDRLRITTAPLKDLDEILDLQQVLENPNYLLNDVALIIESRGVVDSGGRRKVRILQERVLLYPDLTTMPLVSATAGLMTQGDILADTDLNVAWGPIMAKGDIDVPGLTFDLIPKLLGPHSAKLIAGDAFRGKGTYVPGMTDQGGQMLETDLLWQAGGSLNYEKKTSGLLGGVVGLLDDLLGGVTNLVGQLVGGDLTLLGRPINLSLEGGYEDAGTTAEDLAGPDDDLAKGVLVENSDAVEQAVDTFMDSTMNYDVWKQRAIKHNTYIKPLESTGGDDSPKFGNSFDQPLYVTDDGQFTTNAEAGTPLVSLNQLSMKEEIDAINGNVHRVDDLRIDDQILFVDYMNGSETDPGPLQTISLGDNFFWKGVLYICGNVELGNAGASVYTKSPDQFEADADSMMRGQQLDNVLVDGILISPETVTSVGNALIYGTLGARRVFFNDSATGGVYYNSANSMGRLRLPVKSDVDATIMVGRVYEVDKWLE